MKATLTVVSGEASPNQIEISADKPVSMGRARDNQIVIPTDEHASRVHARITAENGRWYLKDFGLNGTRLDGRRIDQMVELPPSAEIRIGEVAFRFAVTQPSLVQVGAGRSPTVVNTANGGTTIMNSAGDEMAALCQFMTTTGDAREPGELVRLGLQAMLTQTRATLVGYLSTDSNDPMVRMVLPEAAEVDAAFSRHLTRRVIREGRAVWLGGDTSSTRGDSTSAYSDAICLPLIAQGVTLGAVHVYRLTGFFSEREARFCEAMGWFLAQALHMARERRVLESDISRLRSHLITEELLGDSPAMNDLRMKVGRAAAQAFTVLITGEPGTDKELVAVSLHRKSSRARGPFVAVNCSSLPGSLIEAELFGYKRHTFTGADRDHPGLFQQADEGTLFLDEVGELSLDLQAKLLRVIDTKSFRPLGATVESKSDVRIVAATNRNLTAEIQAGRFRQDLYYRLNVIEIVVPPLRDHAEDISSLAQQFLDRSREGRKATKIAPAALKELAGYGWPGNTRQLYATLENALAMYPDRDTIDLDLIKRLLPNPQQAFFDSPQSLNWEHLEKWAIERALKQTHQNVSQAAQMVGVSRDTLYIKIKKYNLSRD